MGTIPTPQHRTEFLELRESLAEAASIRHILTSFTNLCTRIIQLGDSDRERQEDYDAGSLILDEFGSIPRELGQDMVKLSMSTSNFEDYLDENTKYEGCLSSLVEM